jgi:rfaE bifunctional protein nucleotidyltransferase chain/domain
MIIAPDGTILQEAGDECQIIGTELDASLPGKVRNRFNTVGPRPWRLADKNKLCDLLSLARKIAIYKESGQQVVFTNGCFDILHEGHVTYLEAARKQGDRLIVGLNSDASIQAIKGPRRPVNNESSRARILAALGCVDHIVIFSDDTPLELITTLLPDVLVKGSDWPIDQIVGAREVMAAGGEVKTIEFVGNFSTTGLIEKIRQK